MPNFGLYAQPDGPFPNPADLLPRGQIEAAREAQMEMAEACTADMLYVARIMAEVGADGINFDTTASTGDAEFLAMLRRSRSWPPTTDLAIEVGMAAEFVLGFHGELEYKGKRLAGMWPHQQVKVVEEAGAHLFGPVVNTNSRKSGAVERRPRRDHRQGVLAGRRRSPSTPTWAWASAACRCSRCRRPTCSRAPARPWSRSAASTGCRWAPAIPTGCRSATRSPPAWGASAPLEIWWRRMQLRRKMRLPEAKKYVADKLKVGVADLADSTVMRGLRQELDIGVITAVPGARKGIEAKRNIAELLDVEVPCLKRL